MHRRDALRVAAGGLWALWLGRAAGARAEEPRRKTGMGLVIYCCGHRQKAEKQKKSGLDLADPLVFLDHARSVGAGGIQMPLGVRDAEYAANLRRRAQQYGMYVEGIAGAPYDAAGQERFEAELRTAALAGVRDVRTVLIPGRRYESFDSLEKFRESERRAAKAVELAAPVAEKHRVRLAIENHRDHRVGERVALLKRISSRWVGACVDTANNLALLDDPVEVVRALAPYAFSVHLKDELVQPCDDGILFADPPLGQGCLDLKTMVGILRAAQPEVRFSLEQILRDPLVAPCLAEKYWITMPDVPARDLARTLRFVRQHRAERFSPVDSLSADERVALETSFLESSLTYAAEQLKL